MRCADAEREALSVAGNAEWPVSDARRAVTADADLSDAEIRAAGRHKSAKVLPRYAKRTMKQVAEGAKKRRRTRTEGGQLSE